MRLWVCLSLLLFSCLAHAKPVLEIQHWVTTKGARVYFVQSTELPMVDIQMTFAAGSSRDSTQAGLAELTNNMLTEGSLHLTANQIAAGLDAVGAIVNTSTGRDTASASLRSLTDRKALTPALSIFSDLISYPQFSVIEFKRQQQQAINNLKMAQQSPSYLADTTFFEAVYGKHPYAHPVHGTLTSITQLAPTDLKKFYQRYYVASNAVIAIVGAVDQSTAKNIAEEITAHLPQGTAAPALPLAEPAAHALSKTTTIPTQQTHLRLGQVGITHHDPDYFSLEVGNYILGGDPLISRLATVIRVQHGLSYHVSSEFLAMAERGPFIISIETRTAEANLALQLAKTTLEQFIKQGPSENDLQSAKKDILASFLLRIKNNAAITAQLIYIGFYQLPLDYLDTFKDKINAVTAEQVQSAFQRHIHPERWVTVSVGKAS